MLLYDVSGAARGAVGTPHRNWVHEKIPGCGVEKIHKIVHVWQPNILNNCYELSEGYAPRTTHQGLCPGPQE